MSLVRISPHWDLQTTDVHSLAVPHSLSQSPPVESTGMLDSLAVGEAEPTARLRRRPRRGGRQVRSVGSVGWLATIGFVGVSCGSFGRVFSPEMHGAAVETPQPR